MYISSSGIWRDLGAILWILDAWHLATVVNTEKKEIIHLLHPSQVYSEDLTELLEVFTYVEPRWANLLERTRWLSAREGGEKAWGKARCI